MEIFCSDPLNEVYQTFINNDMQLRQNILQAICFFIVLDDSSVLHQ